MKLAGITKEDTVLEIGGGLGILTEELVKIARQVYVIEIERGLVDALQHLLEYYNNLEVIEGDALIVELPEANKIVANLPYSISSEITFRLLQELKFDSATLMFQKEFAQRLLARPGTQDYSRLTVNTRYQAEVELVLEVPAKMFYPIPAVDSTVVKMKHRTQGLRAKDDFVFFWTINGMFSYPNKNLRKALGIWLRNIGVSRNLADEIISRCGGTPKSEDKLRTISIENLIILSDVMLDLINDKQILDPRRK